MSKELLEEEDLEWEEWNPDKISFHSHMIAGSLAGLAEHVCLFPIDTIKTHIQCQKCGAVTPSQTWLSAVRMIQGEGVFRLWRGVSAMFAGCIPAHALYFSVFEAAKKAYGADNVGHNPVAAAMTGATAAFSHDLIMTPFDTIKQRMQLGYHKNIFHCIREVSRVEGIRSFYLSLPTTLAMNLPHGGIVIAVNESMRKMFLGRNSDPKAPLSVTASLISGSVAGGVSAFITTPMDVIKTRLQTQHLAPCSEQQIVKMVAKKQQHQQNVSPNSISKKTVVIDKVSNIHYDGCIEKGVSAPSPSAAKPKSANIPIANEAISEVRMNMRQAVWRVWAQEGAVGFFRGAVPRILSQAPAVAISWTVYENLKNLLNSLSDS
jgi:solute carrier family 25 iron transporter 28/37